MHRFTCVSSTGRDTLPSVPPWWALRSWRCRRVAWTVTRTLMTTNEMTFTSRLFLLSISNRFSHSSAEHIIWRDVLQIFYGAQHPISKSTENIFIWQMKQYFDNEPHINDTRLLCFKNIRHLALCGMNLIIVALINCLNCLPQVFISMCNIHILWLTQPAVNWFPVNRKMDSLVKERCISASVCVIQWNEVTFFAMCFGIQLIILNFMCCALAVVISTHVSPSLKRGSAGSLRVVGV